jgi:integrase
MRRPLPPWLEDGQYRNWELKLAARFPLALSEMRWPSKPLNNFDTQPPARWGIDIMTGWRPIMERLLEQLEAVITAQPIDERDRFRVLQIKEKFGRCKWPLWSACRKAGLQRIGWHALRHTFASHLVMRRAPLKAGQELLGRSTIEMTMRYSHLSPDVRKDAVRLLDVDPSDNRLTTASFSTVSS